MILYPKDGSNVQCRLPRDHLRRRDENRAKRSRRRHPAGGRRGHRRWGAPARENVLDGDRTPAGRGRGPGPGADRRACRRLRHAPPTRTWTRCSRPSDRPGHRVPAQRGALRADPGPGPPWRAAARREAAGLRLRTRRTCCCAKPTRAGSSSRSTSTTATPRRSRAAKAAIDEGGIGEIVFATWRFGGEANLGTSPHANLIETQCHGLDMMEHLVGADRLGRPQMTDMCVRGPTPPSRSPSRSRPGRWAPCSAATTRRTPTRVPSTSRSTAPPGRLAVEDTVARLTLSRGGRAR